MEPGEDFEISTTNVDEEISKIAGPQLVVPVDNARYALNAANARWGSLYDSLYGTDALGKIQKTSFDKDRAKKVVMYVRKFLDEIFPLTDESWNNINKIKVEGDKLIFFVGEKKYQLKDNLKFVGFNGEKDNLSSILLKNNNLHIDILIDPNNEIGKNDKANISDIIIESALSTIVDNEDSVAAVDDMDKVKCYRNWLGLMKGDLKTTFIKNGKKVLRKLNKDRFYTSKDGSKLQLHGRALLLNRNVGHLMTSPAIKLKDKSEIPEGIMDAFQPYVHCMILKIRIIQELNRSISLNQKCMDLRKLHLQTLFGKVESVLGIEKNSIKVGIMDEERRTTVNLKECIRQVKERIVFINTGFLDRTGDEMHTSFEAGPMIFKGEMKKSVWLNTYENWNVDVGLSCGFSGKAQIGKGMWAMPDKMEDMLEQKMVIPNLVLTVHGFRHQRLRLCTLPIIIKLMCFKNNLKLRIEKKLN